ncbi:MAG: hypothetical protein LBD59_11135 [Prevotellaceae bacterium]|nr:hypothetical protein [Prevotellaceae bacterium]
MPANKDANAGKACKDRADKVEPCPNSRVRRSFITHNSCLSENSKKWYISKVPQGLHFLTLTLGVPAFLSL